MEENESKLVGISITEEIKLSPSFTYVCKRCGDEWGFIPEDYKYKSELYPTICPLCSMPILEMIREVYREEGLFEVIKRVIGRILN